MSNNELPVVLRLATEADLPFIFNSWLRSYRNSYQAKQIEANIYYAEQHKILEVLLEKYDTIIACSPEDSTQIYGFINAGYTDNFFTLNYIYVKHTFRKMGVGKMLLNVFDHDLQYVGIYTHITGSATKLDRKYNMIYHPYIAFKPENYNITKLSQQDIHDNIEDAKASEDQNVG